MTEAPSIPSDPNQIVAAPLDGEGWIPYPLAPDDIVSGTPACEAKILRTVGVSTPTLRAAFFSAQPSKFAWTFPEDETFVMLEGRITIQFESGDSFELGPNDAISVSAGSRGTFDVHEPSRKFTVVTAA